MNNTIVRMQMLPAHVKGITVVDNDGNYNIYINSIFSTETNRQTLDHELDHIINGHFNVIDDIRNIEK